MLRPHVPDEAPVPEPVASVPPPWRRPRERRERVPLHRRVLRGIKRLFITVGVVAVLVVVGAVLLLHSAAKSGPHVTSTDQAQELARAALTAGESVGQSGGVGQSSIPWKSVQISGESFAAGTCPTTSFCVLADANGDVLDSTDPTASSTPAWSEPASVNSSPNSGQSGTVTSISCPTMSGKPFICLLSDTAGDYSFNWTPSNSNTWLAPEPVSANDANALAGVSCPPSSGEVLCAGVDELGNASVFSFTPAGAVDRATGQVALGPTPSWSGIDAIASGTEPSAVACASTSLCVLGTRGGEVVRFGLAAAGPTNATSPQVVDAGHEITALSCPSASLCVAVDSSGDEVASTDPGAAHPTWSKPTSIASGTLGTLSCPSTTQCLAGGASGLAVSIAHPATASASSQPDSTGASGTITTLSCPTTDLCVAADDAGDILATTSPFPASSAPVGGPYSHLSASALRPYLAPLKRYGSASLVAVTPDAGGKGFSVTAQQGSHGASFTATLSDSGAVSYTCSGHSSGCARGKW